MLSGVINRKAANPTGRFSCDDIDECERVYAGLGGMRGMLGYYRAIPEDRKRSSELADRRLEAPVPALGGGAGSAPSLYRNLQPSHLRAFGLPMPDYRIALIRMICASPGIAISSRMTVTT